MIRSAIAVSIAVGFLVAGPSRAGAVERVAMLAPAASIHLAADSDFAAKKDEYMAQVRREMAEWGDKVHHAGRDAKGQVGQAWSATKEAASRLHAAGSDQWDHAKEGFESALGDLKDRWHRSKPD